MAIIPESQYPGKIKPASTEYPYGEARNITLPGDGTGTPWEAAFVNDVFGFQQALLDVADITPTGNPEKANDSQYLAALRRIFGSVEDLAALRALDTNLVDGRVVNVVSHTSANRGLGGGAFYWASGGTEADNNGLDIQVTGVATGRWRRRPDKVSADMFGLRGSTASANWQAAIDAVNGLGYAEFLIPFDVSSLDGDVDCKGVRLVCSDTVLPSATNTFVNHGGVVRGIIAGVNTSAEQINLADRPVFDKSKFIRRDADRDFTVFMAKKNPSEGMLEVQSRENVVTATNSIGGTAATRITGVRNVNDGIGYKHAFASAGHTPSDSVVRTIGAGTITGAQRAAFWDIPAAGGVIRFDTGHVIDEVSILFLLSGGSSDSVTIRWDGVDQDTISLVVPTGGPEFFIYRAPVRPGNSQITLINNGAATAYVAGINAYRPGENMKPDIDVDTFAYSYNANDYTNSTGAVDYALRRHPDAYAGSDPTGGSVHGGETVISQSVRLDGGGDWTNPVGGAPVGSLAAAKRIEIVTNVDVIWPSDAAEVNVVRLNQIGDGAIFKDVRIVAGDMVFDAVWTTMWTTPSTMVSARGLTAREISGVSSEFQCYDRGNEIRQDDSVSFGLRNSWTLFDNERNSNGGVYIASEAGTRAKLYYGPILFNKGTIGTLHTQQVTEFFGKD